MEATQMAIDRWMDRRCDIYIYNIYIYIYNMEILLSHKKEWNNAICSNMDGPRDYHTKRSKSEREYFPGGAVVKNTPANAGDTGLSPGLGRSHMPRSN